MYFFRQYNEIDEWNRNEFPVSLHTASQVENTKSAVVISLICRTIRSISLSANRVLQNFTMACCETLVYIEKVRDMHCFVFFFSVP